MLEPPLDAEPRGVFVWQRGGTSSDFGQRYVLRGDLVMLAAGLPLASFN